MKSLIVFCAVFVGAFALPLTEDNHRFGLVPDGEGRMYVYDQNPVEMEQAPEPTFNANTQTVFLLFTRRNPTAGSTISINGGTGGMGNWVNANGVRVLIHGWNSNRNTAMNTFMTRDFLARADHNVIVVDWSVGAQNPNYLASRNHVAAVGQATATLLNNLVSQGRTAWSRVNIVGHSLGAHCAGNTGKRTSGRVQAIFGTDPAGPLFTMGSADRLAAGDAVYTEALHTNRLTLGFNEPITTASFYPNNGNSQPGCILDVTGACAHERSNLFYSESINSVRFVARRCTAGFSAIQNNNCPTGGGTGVMGGDASKGINGVFWLETNNAAPFARG